MRCRFGDQESTAEWHSENLISCPAPSLPPEMEVQSVAVVRRPTSRKCNRLKRVQRICVRETHTIDMYSVDGFEPVSEVQRLELEYNRAKAEIQDVEIRPTWPGTRS